MKLPVIDDADVERPRTYGDCLREGWGDHDATGPCPWVSCAHHLAWWLAMRGEGESVNPTLKPGDARAIDALDRLDFDAMPHTCALRASELELTLGEVGDIFAVTRERIRQVETKALARVSHPSRSASLRQQLDGGEVSRPDLKPRAEYFLSPTEVRAGEIRVNPLAARFSEEASRRQGGSLSLASLAIPRASSAPPVRVLTGEERARRISGLKARGVETVQEKRIITVRGRSLTQEQWAAEFGVTSSALSQARRNKDISIEKEIERRLDLRRDEADVEPSKPTSPRETAPAPVQTPSAPIERPSNPSAPSPTTALSTTSSPLAAIAELIAAAEKHGGVAELLADARVGAAVRRAIAEVSG